MLFAQKTIKNFQPPGKEAFYSLVYSPNDFLENNSEQILIVQFGTDNSKDHYHDVTDFSLHSFYSYCEDIDRSLEEFKEFLSRANKELLSYNDYLLKIVAVEKQLKIKNVPSIQGAYVEGFTMFNRDDFVAIVGETDSQYFAFYWEIFQ